MTGKELLMFAAKAAGIKLLYCPNGLPRDCTGMHELMNIFASPIWNPLTDDGDALRLAVMLDISVMQPAPEDRGNVLALLRRGVGASEPRLSDNYAATRRAIVRAAAEIGKAIP